MAPKVYEERTYYQPILPKLEKVPEAAVPRPVPLKFGLVGQPEVRPYYAFSAPLDVESRKVVSRRVVPP